MANKTSYSGKELTTAVAVPGTLLSHHKEYATLTNQINVLHTIEHGYSQRAASTLDL